MPSEASHDASSATTTNDAALEGYIPTPSTALSDSNTIPNPSLPKPPPINITQPSPTQSHLEIEQFRREMARIDERARLARMRELDQDDAKYGGVYRI